MVLVVGVENRVFTCLHACASSVKVQDLDQLEPNGDLICALLETVKRLGRCPNQARI